LIAAKTNLNVRVAADPIHSVINGAIQSLQSLKEKEHWWKNIDWPSFDGRPKSCFTTGSRFVRH
jgi:hypothetical protein